MSIDAVINKIIPDGNDLILDLMAREVGGLNGQGKMIIKNATHIPMVGQEIWGGSELCIIEPGYGILQQKHYRRTGLTCLKENFDYSE